MLGIRKKLISVAMLICLLFQLCSCFLSYVNDHLLSSVSDYEFLNDTSEITAIEIVENRFDYYRDDEGFHSNPYQNVLVSIGDIDLFLDEFNDITYTDTILKNPMMLSFGDSQIGIKITYANGEYELINYSDYKFVYEKSDNAYTWGSEDIGEFDKDAFYDLLYKYMSSCESPELFLMHEVSDIASIKIVDAYITEHNHKMVQTEIATIDDIDEFLSKLKSLKYEYTLPTNDLFKYDRRNAIEIYYNNGDYEVIDDSWREMYVSSRDIMYNAYIGEFDKEEFNALINWYIN